MVYYQLLWIENKIPGGWFSGFVPQKLHGMVGDPVLHWFLHSMKSECIRKIEELGLTTENAALLAVDGTRATEIKWHWDKKLAMED